MPRRISLVVSGCVLGDPQNNPGEFPFYELAGRCRTATACHRRHSRTAAGGCRTSCIGLGAAEAWNGGPNDSGAFGSATGILKNVTVCVFGSRIGISSLEYSAEP